ncbi:MAG: leucine-rich repeat domain-containing protein [Acetatifactor sp.]|nr:leucine-rich repeat domain-containing protein [Acetatifactor sp.]
MKKLKSGITQVRKYLWSMTILVMLFVVMLSPMQAKASSEELTPEVLWERLEALKVQFPNGRYWNHVGSEENNPEGTTDTPCGRHSKVSEQNKTCNYVMVHGRSTNQCWGFANLLSDKLYGTYFDSWTNDRDLENVKPGDVLQYGYDYGVTGHTVMVLAISGDDVYVVDCNSDDHCIIRWNGIVSKKFIDSKMRSDDYLNSTNRVYHAPVALPLKEGYCGSDATYSLDENGTLVIQGTGSLYDHFFEGREDVKKVIIQDGITGLGVKTFGNCKNLESVQFPMDFSIIYAKSFQSCSSLKQVNVPSGLKELGSAAFNNCAIEQYELPKGLETIGTNVFYGCPGFAGNESHYVLADGTVCISGRGEIYSNLFKNRTDLKKLVVENGIRNLGTSTFEGCTGLTQVILPEGLKIIGKKCFSDCRSLKTVNLPEYMSEISDYAFYNCALTSTELPENLDKEGELLFQGCPGACGNHSRYVLESRVLRISGTGAIYDDAFYYKRNFDKVYVGEGITAIGEWAFGNSYAEYVELPNSLTKIEDNAFAYCDYLSQVDCYAQALVLDWVEPTRESFISNPEKSTVFNVAADQLTNYEVRFGDVQNVTFCGALPGSEEPVYTVKKGECGETAYYDLKSDGTLIVEGFGRLEYNAFDAYADPTWKTVKNIIICNGIAECLGFYGFEQLETVTLAETAGCFLNNALFEENEALTDVYAYVDPAYLNNGEYFGKDGLRIHVLAKDLDAWQNHKGITKQVVFIGDLEPLEEGMDFHRGRCGIDAYYEIDEMNTLHVTGSGQITDKFFSTEYKGNRSSTLNKYQYEFSFEDVQKVVIGDGITGIGKEAFKGLTSVTEVVFPDSLKTIGNSAFDGCNLLTTFALPNGLKRIGEGAFIGCTGVVEFISVANPDTLTWPKLKSNMTFVTDDFRRDGAKTICHVPSNYVRKYQEKFAEINVTFVGNLDPELLGLSFGEVKEQPASCTENGRIAYYLGSDDQIYVSKAGILLEDQNGDGVVDVFDVIIPAMGHSHDGENSLSWRWEKAGEDFAVTACLKCMRCGAFEESVPAEVVKTEGENGVTYVATATIGDTEVSMTREIKNEYYVTLDGTSSTHAYGDRVQAYAAAPSEGMAFAGWYEGETLVCTSTDIDFLVYRNVALHTVYVDAAQYVEPAEPILNFDLSERVFDEAGNQKLDMTVTWYLSDGMSVKDVGLVRTTDEEAELSIENEEVKKRSAGVDNTSGTFIHHLTLGEISSALTAYAKAYLVYDDAQGEEHVLYTDVAASAPVALTETTRGQAADSQEEVAEEANDSEESNDGEENNAGEAGDEPDNEEKTAEQGE